MNRLTRYGLFPLVLLLASGAWLAWWMAKPDAPIESQVLTGTASRGEIVETVSANGTLNPVTLVSVGTQVSGTALSVHADFNDRVEKGQVLVKLDPAAYEARVRQTTAQMAAAQATLDLARANKVRAVDLFDKGYIPKQELDSAQQALKSAQAQVEQAHALVEDAEVDLRNSVILSPIAGVVVKRTVDTGQTVAASFQTPTLFQIAEDLKKMLIHTTFAEADIGRIEPGQPAKFTVDAHPDRAYTGTVRQVRLNPTTTQNVVTYDVVVDVTNEDLSLLPGMTAYVSIELSRTPDVLRVPNAALRYRPKDDRANAAGAAASTARSSATPGAGVPRAAKHDAGSGRRAQVYVIRHGMLAAVPVQVGRTDGRLTAVTAEGLKDGDVVVTADRVADRPGVGTTAPRMRMF
jgi:HlyD family secretion protein